MIIDGKRKGLGDDWHRHRYRPQAYHLIVRHSHPTLFSLHSTMATPTGNDANLTGKKLNVLVYSGSLTHSAWQLSRFLTDTGPTGTGTTVDSVRHTLYTLRRLLAPHYAVTPVTGDMLLKEPSVGLLVPCW
jgi:Uncharacterized conserved protein